MTAVQVFDPPMCCSTGVCGPAVDPELVRFAADLDWLKGRGVSVERFNLAQQPAAFVGDPAVKAALETEGQSGLPLVKVDGTVRSRGTYPSREQLAAWAGLGATEPGIYSESVAELVAIGAAIASNCEPCFRFHYDQARRLGVSREDMRRAVATAQGVKDAPAQAMLALADRYLRARSPEPAGLAVAEAAPEPGAGGCCSPATKTAGRTTRSKCC